MERDTNLHPIEINFHSHVYPSYLPVCRNLIPIHKYSSMQDNNFRKGFTLSHPESLCLDEDRSTSSSFNWSYSDEPARRRFDGGSKDRPQPTDQPTDPSRGLIRKVSLFIWNLW